jgi:hypothetical protein
MENKKTEMETVKEECKLCGAEGVRTTFKHPDGCVQVIYKCDNLDCELGGAWGCPEPEVKGICPNCKEQTKY